MRTATEAAVETEVALLAKALGHPARVKIMRLLLAHDVCHCGQLVDELELARATVSQHLKVLKDAGFISGEIEGLRTSYCASRDRLTQLHDLLGAMLDEAVEMDTSGSTEIVVRPRPPAETAVLARLSTLDRFLPLWIGLAMAAGIGLGRLVPSLNDGLKKLQIGTVSCRSRSDCC